MAKKRTLDIEGLIFDSDLVSSLGPKGILFYEMLWGNAEDWGGIELNSKDLRLKMGAITSTTKEIDKFIEILSNGLKKLIPYEYQGRGYGWIKNFLKNQQLNNPALPKIPLPEWITFEVKEYPSRKKYAHYSVITEKIPVAYQYTTGNTDTIPYHTILPETLEVITNFFNYYLLKTKKTFKLSPVTKSLIKQRLDNGYSLEQLKLAVDNFIQDDWKDREKHMELVYCIGVRNKVDNLEKWLNYKPKPKVRQP
jgi:uncharacterized phage protein (TIGR02220 family)